MTNKNKVYIAGIGMITAIGANAEMTSVAVKAGISGYSKSQYIDKTDSPITMACVPSDVFTSMQIDIKRNSSYRTQYDHMIKMAILALQNAISSSEIQREAIKQPIPLILAMPESSLTVEQVPTNLLVESITQLSGLPIAENKVHCIHTGRAAGIQALDYARRYLFELGHDYVLVGGSDSGMNLSLISHLNEQQRLLSETSKDGFALGEASGFLLLTRHADCALIKHNQMIRVHVEGVAEEAGHLTSEKPYRGDGLDIAFKQALNHYSGNPISAIYSSMNGESFWSKEQGVATIRNKQYLGDGLQVEHPADGLGDVGCATGAMLMGLSALDLLNQQQLATHLVYGSSDGAMRAAVLLEKITAIHLNKG